MRIFLRSVSLFFILLFSLVAQSQTMDWGWSRSYGSAGSESINNIATDSKNAIYTTGPYSGTLQVGSYTFTAAGGQDFVLMKHDTSGNLIWAKSFGGTNADVVKAISTDINGDIVMIGYFTGNISFDGFSMTSAGPTDAFLVKLNGSGTILWAKQIGGTWDDFGDVLKCYKDNIYIGGRYYSTDFSIGAFPLTKTHVHHNFLARLDMDGNAVWAANGSGNTAGLIGEFPFIDIEIVDDYSVEYFGTIYTIGVNFNPGSTSGLNSPNWVSIYRLRYTKEGAFVRQSISGMGSRAVNGRPAMDENKKVTFAGALVPLSNTPEAALIKRDSLENLLSGNLSNELPSQIPGTSVSFLYDVTLDSQKGAIAVGNFMHGTTFNQGFATPVLPPGYGGILIWRTDSLMRTINILTSKFSDKFEQSYQAITIDTINNIAYTGGFFARNTTTNNQFIIGSDTLLAQGDRDFIISKIYLDAAAPSSLIANAGNDTAICNGGSASIGVGATGGSPSYYYRWSPATGLSDPDAAVTTATPTSTTTYVLTITDAHLTTRTDTVIVNVLPPLAAPTITASGPLSFCPGGSVTLTASAAANYLWSTGAATQSITVNTAGNYSVSIADGTGCNSPTATIAVNVFAQPAQPVVTASGPLQFCQGGSVTLTSTPANTYLWSNGATTQSITVNTAGNYSVTVFNADGCSSVASEAQAVSILSAPVQPIVTAAGPVQFCEGGSVVLTASTANAYLWSNGATTQSITVNTSGNYSVVVSNTDGCSSVASAATAVTVWPTPVQPVITASGPIQFCEGGSVTLTSSPASSYLWSNGATTQSITVSTGAAYSVVTSSADGCNSVASAPVTVTVWSNPAKPVITASGPLQFCEGGSVQLNAPGATTYLWSNGATTQNITASTTGNYSVIVSNTQGCSSPASDPVSVNVLANPAQPVISASGPLQFCEGGSVNLSSSSSNTYLWSNGATTQSITINTGGTYSVVVTNSNGCSSIASAPATVTVNSNPAQPVITASGPLSFCQGDNVTLTSSTATAYTWSNGATTSSISVNSAGNFSVVVSNAQGCNSIASAVTSTTVKALPPVPVITRSGNLLSSSAATGNQWYFDGNAIPGATSNTLLISGLGNYSVQVTNAEGCSISSAPFTVENLVGRISILNNGDQFIHLTRPNPANTQSTLNFQLARPAKVSVALVNSRGSLAGMPLTTRQMAAGSHEVRLDNFIRQLPAGVYHIVYIINNERITDKLVIAK